VGEYGNQADRAGFKRVTEEGSNASPGIDISNDGISKLGDGKLRDVLEQQSFAIVS
jgi:hypothetical protein